MTAMQGQTIVTGTGAVRGACDATPFLRIRKLRKFMSKQDNLAVVAAARALHSASLDAPLGERCGLYLAVGYIPFEANDIERLIGVSLEDGRFSMTRFSANAFGAINPLLTFRVLPNMPAFHVSLNLDIQGPYVVSYPGIGQFYSALDEAQAALGAGVIDVALVGAVADQKNFLVEHHFARISPPIEAGRLADVAAFLVMERPEDAKKRGAPIRGQLIDYDIHYRPIDRFAVSDSSECITRGRQGVQRDCEFGPASLALFLAETDRGRITHRVRTRDGFSAESTWELT